MKYSVEKSDEYAIMTVGETNLNSIKAPDLKSELIVQKQAGIKNLILNLSQVQYIDSSGLSAILTGNRIWMEDGGLFFLTGIEHPSVKMLINISRLDSVLNIKESNNDAVKIIMMEALKNELGESQTENSETESENEAE